MPSQLCFSICSEKKIMGDQAKNPAEDQWIVSMTCLSPCSFSKTKKQKGMGKFKLAFSKHCSLFSVLIIFLVLKYYPGPKWKVTKFTFIVFIIKAKTHCFKDKSILCRQLSVPLQAILSPWTSIPLVKSHFPLFTKRPFCFTERSNAKLEQMNPAFCVTSTIPPANHYSQNKTYKSPCFSFFRIFKICYY